MAKNYLDERSNLTNGEVIKLICELLKENGYQADDLKEIKKIGKFGIINPGVKNLHSVLKKLVRKLKTDEDKKNKTSLEEIFERELKKNKHLITDNVPDVCRFSIIVPSWTNSPAIIASILGEFGGTVEIKNKPSYKAFHINTAINEIGTEFQIHTEETIALKAASDPFYHEHVNDEDDEEKEKSEEEKIKINKISKTLDNGCQIVYDRSGFQKVIPDVQEVYQNYLSRGPIQPKPKEPKDILKFYSDCYFTQNNIEKRLSEFLKNMTKRSKLDINTNSKAFIQNKSNNELGLSDK